ncbi:MAG: glycosyltransferase, partial [Woeseia sp.]
MHRPINILDLRDSPWVDGPGRTVLQTAESLDRERFKLIVGGFCGDDASDNIYLSDASQRGLETCAIVEKAAFDLNVVRQIMATIDELGIDMLHTHDFRSNLAGLYCAWRKQIPIVSTCHGWIANNFKRSVYKSLDILMLRRFDRVITVSELMKRQLLAEGVQARNVDVVVNALIIGDYHPDHEDRRFRRGLGISDNCTLLMNIGRLSLEKGQALLLEAYAEISKANSNTRLAFVGIGPEEQSLRTLVRDLGLEDRVVFAGYQSDMLAVYNSADLV